MKNDISYEEYMQFLRDRINYLMDKHDLSAYKLSLGLGNNQGYITKILNKKSNPSMKEFLKICEYFGVKPAYFFDCDVEHPEVVTEAIDKIKLLNEDDLQLTVLWINRFLN